MKNKLKILFCSIVTIFGLSSNGYCQCTDQNNNTIHCLYRDVTTGKYYTIDANDNRHLYLPQDGDIVLELQPKKEILHDGSVIKRTHITNDGGPNSHYYVYNKNNEEYRYSPNNFQKIDSSKFDLYTVALSGDGSVMLRPHDYIQEDIKFDDIDNDSDSAEEPISNDDSDSLEFIASNSDSNSKKSTRNNTDDEIDSNEQYINRKTKRNKNNKNKIFYIVKDKEKLKNKENQEFTKQKIINIDESYNSDSDSDEI